jgi:acyl-coenzyme A thioesterase 13
MRAPPEGFTPTKRSSGFLDLIGPAYETPYGADYRLGLYLDARHANLGNNGHGGVSATLLDIYLGRLIAMSQTPPRMFVTVSLTIDYLKPAPIGCWLEAQGEIDRVGKRLGYSRGKVFADGVLVARANAIYQMADALHEKANSDA